MVFHALTFAWSRGSCLNRSLQAECSNHLPRDPADVNEWNKHGWSLFLQFTWFQSKIAPKILIVQKSVSLENRMSKTSFEPWHDKTNKVTALSEDWDQPGHLPSLIRVFAVRMKKAWVLSYPLSAQRRLWSDWADAQAHLSLRWAHTHFVGFVMSRLISTNNIDVNKSILDKMIIPSRNVFPCNVMQTNPSAHLLGFSCENHVLKLNSIIWTWTWVLLLVDLTMASNSYF